MKKFVMVLVGLGLAGCSGFDGRRMGAALQGAGAGMQSAQAPQAVAVAPTPLTMRCTSPWSSGQRSQHPGDLSCVGTQ